MKGLLIAYSFSPHKNVGALRPTYWAEEMSRQHNLQLDVITAVQGDASDAYQRFVVPNESSSFWSFLIKDEGLTWRKDLIRFLRGIDVSNYDFVILTGGPFFHFSIGHYFENKGVKVIMDYRDPFSYNPRFNEKGLKKWIKKWYERRFLKAADLVLTVNDVCHEYIGESLNLNRGILPNGYDERCVEPKAGSTMESNELFYAGRFYWEPELLFDVLNDMNETLVHAGPEPQFVHPYLKSDAYHELGMLSQREMYKSLANSGIGLVFTMDIPFESTTKIYDYMGLNRKMLIITKGEPGKGVLNRELEHYPYYRWVSYNKEEISKAISELKQMSWEPIEADRFSRKEGLRTLVNYIHDVTGK